MVGHVQLLASEWARGVRPALRPAESIARVGVGSDTAKRPRPASAAMLRLSVGQRLWRQRVWAVFCHAFFFLSAGGAAARAGAGGGFAGRSRRRAHAAATDARTRTGGGARHAPGGGAAGSVAAGGCLDPCPSTLCVWRSSLDPTLAGGAAPRDPRRARRRRPPHSRHEPTDLAGPASPYRRFGHK